jgi:hypothetical protein
LNYWLQKHEEKGYGTEKYHIPEKMIKKVNLKLEDVCSSLRQGAINKAVQALINTFKIIPMNCSFRGTLPDSIYWNIQNLIKTLDYLYKELTTEIERK